MTIQAPLFLPGVDDGTGNLEPKYSARDFRQLVGDLLTEGVLDRITGHLSVSERAAGANFSVDVAAGKAAITGDDQAGQGRYRVESTATENLGVEPAPGSGLHRKDLVVAEVLDAGVDATNPNEWRLRAITGEAVADTNTPPVPALPNTATPLAEVGPITSATTAITDALIVDRRAQASAGFPVAIHDAAGPDSLGETYPIGVTLAQVWADDGWPLTGTLITARRSVNRMFQVLAHSDVSLESMIWRAGRDTVWGAWRDVIAPQGAMGDVTANESTTSTAFTSLTTAGPFVDVVVPQSGRLRVRVEAEAANSTAGSASFMGFDVRRRSDDVELVAPSDAHAALTTSANRLSVGRETLLTGLPALTSVRVRALYRVGANTGSWQRRRLIAGAG